MGDLGLRQLEQQQNDDQLKALFGATAEMDKQLRAALKTAHPDEPVPQSLTDRILANWERLLCENYEFAAERNVETLLWKNLVYRTIDEYRRVLKQYEQLAAKTPAGKVQLKKLESQFLAFLQRMNGYYTALVDKLATEYDVEFLSDVLHGEGIGAHTPTENPTPLQEKVIACCHRTIVYLGDLARYREQRSERSPKDYFHAQQYYESAFQLLPDSGNPLNQLAVIATYYGDDLSALYFYYRSLLVRLPFPTIKDNLKLLFQKNRRTHDDPTASIPTQKSKKQTGLSSRKAFALGFVYVMGLFFNHDASGLKDAVDECHRLFRTALHDGSLMVHDARNVMAVLFGVIFTGSTERRDAVFTVEAYRLAALIVHDLLDRLLKHFDVIAAEPSMLAIRMFLLHLTSAAKPPAELTSTATWHNMVQSLVAFGNLLAQRFPKRPPGFGLRVAFEEDYAFRGYMPLASVLDKAHFAAARQQKQPKPAEMGVARAYSIIDLLKSCTELQILAVSFHDRPDCWEFSFTPGTARSERRATVGKSPSPARATVTTVLPTPHAPSSGSHVPPPKDDGEGEDEVIMFAGMSSKQPRSNLPSATFALTKRDSTGASPIGQERRSSGNSALPVPDAASTSLWNNFPSSGASLFGNIMSGQVSAEQAIRRDVQAEQVPAGTSIASYMDAVHNSPAAIRHSAPSAPAFVSTGASTSYTSQQRGFPGSFQQQTMSMPFSGAPQQHQYPRQPQPQPHQTSAPTPNLFQGNPLNWLGTTAAAPMESQTDRSAYFQMPFNLEQEQPK